MKKEEIKSIFEENLENIKISKELKEKTLNNIYSKNNVYRFPYLIKNCAAIFIVTCICLSIYIINNKPNSINELSEATINSESIIKKSFENVETQSIDNSSSFMLKSSRPSANNSIIESLQNKNEDLHEYDSVLMDGLEKQDDEILTEEDFLLKNPTAKKTNEGYMIIKNNKKTIYIFENGLLIEKKG